jgi:DNA-binding NarL/FixJ family response regulator
MEGWRGTSGEVLVRVVLADDHTLILEAFKMLLAGEVEIVGTARDGHELIRVVRDTRPDVVVSDISMPGLNGVDAKTKLAQYLPDVKFIFLTVSEDPETVARSIRAGAHGYLLKSSVSSELLHAIRAVARGEKYFTPAVAGAVASEKAGEFDNASAVKLTVRQREILQLLAEGRSMIEAASILNLTPRTIAFHKYRIMKALGIDSNAGLVQYAVKHKLIS